MGNKDERELNGIYEVSNILKANYDGYIMDEIPTIEDYGLDIIFSAGTEDAIARYEMEVKTNRYGPFKQADSTIAKNWYPCRNCPDNPNSIGNYMRFCDVPPSSSTIATIDEWTTTMSYDEIARDATPIPDNITGTPIYILNATTKDGIIKYKNIVSKGRKIWERQDTCLAYNMKDGLILFSNRMLRSAFKGYCWYYTSHTTDKKSKDMRKIWELKMMFDLTKGRYIKKPQFL